MKKLFLALILILHVASAPAWGAWAETGAASGTFQDTPGSTMTLSSFNSGTGSNRLIACGMAFTNASDLPDSVTFASGESMSVAGSNLTAGRAVAIYKLFNPTASGVQNVVVDFNGAETDSGFLGCMALTGGDGTHDGSGTSSTGSGSPMGTTITGTASGDMVIDVLYSTVGGGGATITADGSQTLMYECDTDSCFNNGSIRRFGFSREESTGTSTAMTWTGTTLGDWTHLGVSFNPAAGGGDTSTVQVIQQ